MISGNRNKFIYHPVVRLLLTVNYNGYFKSFIVYLQVFSELCCKLQSFCFHQKQLLDRGSCTIGHVYFTQFMRSF